MSSCLEAKLLQRDEYFDALQLCSNLTELELSRASISHDLRISDKMIADVFFNSWFPNLKDLCAGCFKGIQHNTGFIASCTGN